MKIKKIEFKNINSYGNNLQSITFDHKPGLILLYGENGAGKCLLKGTKVRMLNGLLKKVEDIKIGDKLIGPDSKIRTVSHLHNGYTHMYNIFQKKGINYTVTENHKLSLRKAGKKEEFFLTPKEYLKLNKSQQRLYTGHISEKVINYPIKNTNINPYILGLWLGDGTTDSPEITNIDQEVIDEIYKYSKILNCDVIKTDIRYSLCNKNGMKKVEKIDNNGNVVKIFESAKLAYEANNHKGTKIQDAIKNKHKTLGYEYRYMNDFNFRDLLRLDNVLCNKHIPRNYLINSKKVRLDILAGLIDSDGHVSNNGIEITQKSYILIKNIEELCNSLGFKTYLRKIKKQIKSINFEGEYWRLSISSNDLSIIPLRIGRKKNGLWKNKEKKDKSRTGIEIIYNGIDEYYGFTLLENPLFLLEDYTVTHNSTVKQVLDVTTFGKTQGKSGKRLALKELPNRRNGSLFTSIEFDNNHGQEIRMERSIKPNKFEMFVNHEPYSERFKLMSAKERENLVGYSYEIFKSFISMNINDFKNFISLSKDDKETLLNKLFNLNQLDDLLSITVDLDKANQSEINSNEDIIYDNDNIILDYKQSIHSIKSKIDSSRSDKIKNIKASILEIKPEYNEVENSLIKNREEKDQVNNKFTKLNKLKFDKNKVKTRFELEIENIEEKIETYESGVCPVCETNLTDDSHKDHLIKFKNDILEKKSEIDKCNKYLNRCILEGTKINNHNDRLYSEKNSLNERFTSLKSNLVSLTRDYNQLKSDSEETLESTDNLQEKIDSLKEKNRDLKLILVKLQEKSDTYEELKKILNFNGIRKSLINNAIQPINKYLKKYLKDLDSSYSAVLSDEFDATIYELETLKINPETLSKGEDRKINIAIAISYLKIILDMKHSNVIFLDEVFDGLSMKNIELVINILDELSREYNTNIIIVAHGVSEMKNFDKIKKKFSYTIEAQKNFFSNLIIKK